MGGLVTEDIGEGGLVEEVAEIDGGLLSPALEFVGDGRGGGIGGVWGRSGGDEIVIEEGRGVDGSFDGFDDSEEGDIFDGESEAESAVASADGADDSCAGETSEEFAEVFDGDACGGGDVLDLCGAGFAAFNEVDDSE